jgi:anthranilate synthase component 1
LTRPSGSPDRATFRALARAGNTIVPVWRELLADLTTPVAAFARIVGDEPGFLLESVEHGERWSRWSFMGRRPQATLLLRGGRLEVDGELPAAIPTDRGILAAIEALLARHTAPVLPDLPPLHGGLVGYLGYDVVREVERLPAVPPDDQGLPDAVISVIGSLVAYDHWRQRVTLVESVDAPAGASDAELDALHDLALERLDEVAAIGASPRDEPLVEPPQRDAPVPDVRRTVQLGDWTRAVETAKELILEGDIFQVVLSQRFDLDLGAEPFDLYRALRQVNPSPYMYFLRHPEVTLVGSSPEPMVQLLEGRVISRPIAGTRKRGRTDEEDRRMAAELVEHPKEVAEHVMLVDLARNDVGRVVDFGTEVVDELMSLERYSHVMHLTSQVSGRLRAGLGPIDVLRATLPAGTVSGAPKVRAMEIIDDLEPTKRGPYAGVVGYVDFSGNLDTAITIRTMVVRPDGTASVQAGAGIVADSDPADEDLECRNKAAALLSAVPAARRITDARQAPKSATIS